MEAINEDQRQVLDELESQVPDLEVRWNDERGVASLLEGKLLPWDQERGPKGIVSAILDRYGLLLGPPDVVEGHRVTGIGQDAKTGGYRARAGQIVNDLPVYGATLLVFADEERGVYRVQSSFWREVRVTAERELDEDDLRRRLLERLRRDKGAAAFEDGWREEQPDAWSREHFPLTGYPTLYLYRVQDGFHPAYHALAYQPADWHGVDGVARREIGQAQLVVDAATGEILVEESTKLGLAYTDEVGDGLSTLEDSSGTSIRRPLHVVRKDGGTYFMLNRLQTPPIRTYDAGGTKVGLANKLKDDAHLSQDADGHWDTTTSSCTANSRRDAQQPEVDGHFFAEEAWNFYHNLGWDGFDDGLYGAHCPICVVAHIGMDANAYFTFYTEPIPNTTTNKYYGYIAFYDGECDGTTLKFDFMAADPLIFAHEYQHAITFFGAAKANGEPGHLGISGWPRAIHEGLSDAFASLRRGLWSAGAFFPDGAVRKPAVGDGPYSRTACSVTATNYCLPFRRVEYPRSTKTKKGDWYCDHYDDRDETQTTQCFNRDYFRSTLLSHLAFLVGQGGVHQRTGRAAELIPVKGIGLGRAAEILHYAVTHYFDTLPNDKGGETMIEAGQYLLDAAKNVPGSSNRTCEYVMMRRALYALGLYPYDGSFNKQTYGGEACMLPWTYSWRFSQPYLGFPALWWKSPDLFINNNGSAEYNAVVGQENKVFARVRNIGDQDLQNVRVRFYFSPMGTNLPASIAGWHPCQDQAGVDCVLDIATLPAGGMNLTDADNPPADQAVQWYLDPASVTPEVDHFCLRAVIECEAANHNHDCPNEVQSNVQHQELLADAALDLGFLVSNWEPEPAALDLSVTHTLPRGYRLVYAGDGSLTKIVLKPGEPQRLKFRVIPPKRRAATLAPPYDGKVVGELEGKIGGRFVGQLSNAARGRELVIERSLKRNIALTGLLAGAVETRQGKASFHGDFIGELDPVTAEIRGKARGSMVTAAGKHLADQSLRLAGCLEPLRAVHFAQLVDGEAVGGISVHVRLPRLRRQCRPKG